MASLQDMSDGDASLSFPFITMFLVFAVDANDAMPISAVATSLKFFRQPIGCVAGPFAFLV